MAHTPGPWKRHPTISHSVVAANGYLVADCHDCDGDEEDNAALIAESPAMLALIKAYRQQHTNDPFQKDDECICSLCSEGWRILSKARAQDKQPA